MTRAISRPDHPEREPLYDTIGLGYAERRRPDVRIGRALRAHLGNASPIINVGAGTGSYEPNDRQVVAVEPSPAMIAQRPQGSAPTVRAVAGALPFSNGSFEGATALLTVHHWPDPFAGLAEMRRVTRGPVVVLTFDREVHARQWLVSEYLPEMAELDSALPSPEAIAATLGGGTVEVVAVPWDCTDGFCHAWWRRPEAYLDETVRAAISGIARLPVQVVEDAMTRLIADIADGTWLARHPHLVREREIDAGYRIVMSPGASASVVHRLGHGDGRARNREGQKGS